MRHYLILQEHLIPAEHLHCVSALKAPVKYSCQLTLIYVPLDVLILA